MIRRTKADLLAELAGVKQAALDLAYVDELAKTYLTLETYKKREKLLELCK